jgi:hypothetical protein
VNIWLYARLGAILVVVIVGCVAPFGVHSASQITWLGLVVIFSVFVVAPPLLVSLQRSNSPREQLWSRPSWKTNPLDWRNPIQFLHFGAFLSLAQGIVLLLRVALTQAPFSLEALVPLAVGAGIWLGIKITLALFTSRFASNG